MYIYELWYPPPINILNYAPGPTCLNLQWNLPVSDHGLITKPDGKTSQSPQVVVAKTVANAPAQVAKSKATKKDAAAATSADRLDRETQRLQRAENQLQHATKGFDAVSVLLQYLVDDVSTIQNDSHYGAYRVS